MEMVEVMNHEILARQRTKWRWNGIKRLGIQILELENWEDWGGMVRKILYLNFTHDIKYKERSRMSL